MKKSTNKRTRLFVLLIGALLASSGCAKKEQPQPQPPRPKPIIKHAVPVQIQASTAKTLVTGKALLDFSNKKDPFKPFITAQSSKAPPHSVSGTPAGEILPIQSYDSNRFRVAGIITGLRENTALIIDPAGRGYVVHVGMMIGTNDGRIHRITPSAIEVIEQYHDDNGHLRKRSVILSLAKKK
jgi:type IV pilus assembly protein PilP